MLCYAMLRSLIHYIYHLYDVLSVVYYNLIIYYDRSYRIISFSVLLYISATNILSIMITMYYN